MNKVKIFGGFYLNIMNGMIDNNKVVNRYSGLENLLKGFD